MYYQECMRCGRVIRPGRVKYLLSIRIVADIDGVTNDRHGDSCELMEEVLGEIGVMDAGDLEGEEYEEMNLALCKSCKDFFVKNPFNLNEDDLTSDSDTTTLVH